MSTPINNAKEIEKIAEINKLYLHTCSGQATAAFFCSAAGIIGTPLVFKKLYKRIPISSEYKLLIGFIAVSIIPCIVANYARERCERNLTKHLQELDLIE